jgi:hypothetical protein
VLEFCIFLLLCLLRMFVLIFFNVSCKTARSPSEFMVYPCAVPGNCVDPLSTVASRIPMMVLKVKLMPLALRLYQLPTPCVMSVYQSNATNARGPIMRNLFGKKFDILFHDRNLSLEGLSSCNDLAKFSGDGGLTSPVHLRGQTVDESTAIL